MLHTILLLILYMPFPYCKGFSRLWTVTSTISPILKVGNPFRSGLREEIGHHSGFIPEQLFILFTVQSRTKMIFSPEDSIVQEL